MITLRGPIAWEQIVYATDCIIIMHANEMKSREQSSKSVLCKQPDQSRSPKAPIIQRL